MPSSKTVASINIFNYLGSINFMFNFSKQNTKLTHAQEPQNQHATGLDKE